MKMIDHVCTATVEYIDRMPKSKRKKYGQFFTSKETAVFMAGLFSIPEDCTSLSILDPGAGSGILSVALLERLESNAEIDTIELVCYENDTNIVDLLRSNLEWACSHATKNVGSETDALKEQLDKSIDLLELTDWQKQKMHEISIDTIGDLISAPEEKLKQAKYIADVRARTIKNAGIAAVCEYLLG